MKINLLKYKYFLLPSVIIFILILNIYSFNFFIKSYLNLENKHNIGEIYSIIDKLNTQYENIKSLTNDYAFWDDSYEFIQDGNEHFIYNNFREPDIILTNLNLDFMIFVNNDNKIIYPMVSLKIKEKNNKEFLNKIKEYDKSNFNEYIININNSYFFICKSEIKKSDLTGEPKGFIYSGVKINIKMFDSIYKHGIKIIDTKLYDKKDLKIENKIFDNIYLKSSYDDMHIINNILFLNKDLKTIFSLEFLEERDIYLEGKSNITTFNIITSILCLIMYFIFYKYISYQDKINEELEKRVIEEVEKQRKQEQLLIQQSKLASMGEMIGNIAHQWRQPLNALGLIIQNMKYTYDANELTDEYMTNNLKKSNLLIKNMSKTIDDFRNFFKPDKKEEVFEVNETVFHSLEMISASLGHFNITILKDLEKDNIKIFGLNNELSQVLLIILSNAKDALIEDAIKNPTISIKTYVHKNDICISIKDNAKGIPKTIIDKIFEPYFTTKQDHNGTGIGLYMAKTIIETNMNGKLSVNSDNNGSEFIISLKIN